MKSPPSKCQCEDRLRDLAERVEVLNSQVFKLKEEVRQLRGDQQEFGGMVVPVLPLRCHGMLPRQIWMPRSICFLAPL